MFFMRRTVPQRALLFRKWFEEIAFVAKTLLSGRYPQQRGSLLIQINRSTSNCDHSNKWASILALIMLHSYQVFPIWFFSLCFMELLSYIVKPKPKNGGGLGPRLVQLHM